MPPRLFKLARKALSPVTFAHAAGQHSPERAKCCSGESHRVRHQHTHEATQPSRVCTHPRTQNGLRLLSLELNLLRRSRAKLGGHQARM